MTIILVMKYTLTYDDDFYEQIKIIERKYYSLIKKKIVEQLTDEPLVETNNRKILDQPNILNADWELRFGPKNQFRVFYEVVENRVLVLAIGIKKGNHLRIGREVVDL